MVYTSNNTNNNENNKAKVSSKQEPKINDNLVPIELKKRVFSNRFASELLQKNFQKLAKSDDPIDEEKILDIYKEVFYIISIDGKHSHKNIVEQSYDFVNVVYNKQLDDKIKKLGRTIAEKDGELIQIENPTSPKPHPIYEDGALLMAGENGIPFTSSTTVWIMQGGRKRAFGNPEILATAKKALSLPEGPNDGRYYLTISELNNIDDGVNISTTSDLNIKGTALIPLEDLPDIQGSSAYYDIELECLGNEESDFTSNISTETIDIPILQFYLNNDACVVKYIKDEFYTDDVGPIIETVNIERGEKATIRILRDSEMSDNNLPSYANLQNYYNQSGYNDLVNITYNGNQITDYERLWGPNKEYNSITYAKGRIMSAEVPNAYITQTLLIPQDTTPRLFNGLPSETTGAWLPNATAGITIIDDPGYLGQELSIYGTNRIYASGRGLYGSLNQDCEGDKLQEEIFDDLTNAYYRVKSSGGHKIYGQPIFRYDNHYCVLLRCYKSGLTRYFEYIRLGTNHVKRKQRGDFTDATGLQMDYSGGDIYGVRWNSISKSRIKFVGLQEYKTNEHHSSENFFNPPDGSNYEINNRNSGYGG